MAINQDSGLAAVTDTLNNTATCTNSSSANNGGGLATFVVSRRDAWHCHLGMRALITFRWPWRSIRLLYNDTSQAIAAVTTASQTNALDLLPLPSGTPARISMQLPTGAVFDALNQLFLIADSAANNVILVDPLTSETGVHGQHGDQPYFGGLQFQYQHARHFKRREQHAFGAGLRRVRPIRVASRIARCRKFVKFWTSAAWSPLLRWSWARIRWLLIRGSM